MHLNLRHNFIGPFQFLVISLIASEILLGFWMSEVIDNSSFTERIVAGSLFVTILIAVLVVFCVVYWIKRKYDHKKALLTTKQGLTSETINDILTNLPGAKKVRKVKMNTKIKKVSEELRDITNVLVVNDKDNPLGVLYRWDLADQAKVKINEHENTDDNNLSDVIELITEEFISNKSWSKKEGVVNYALLSLSDNLLQAKQKMVEIAKSDEVLLSVRGCVIDKDAKIIAIINFADLTKRIV